MIFGTYSISGISLLYFYISKGIILALSGALFTLNVLNAVTQTITWSIIAFFASAAASSAYLTVSEIFPLEIRAIAISMFYSAGKSLQTVL